MRISAASRSADRRAKRREPWTTQYRRFARVQQRSMLLDGVAQYGRADAAARHLVGDFSAAIWFRVTAGSPSASIETIWSLHNVAGSNRMILNVNYGIDADPTVKFGVYSNPDVAFIPGLAGGVDIKDGNWHNVVLTHTLATDTVRVYIDGALELTHVAAGAFGITVNSRVTVGQEWDGATPSDFFQGNVAEVAHWDRVLTLAEAQALAAERDPRRLGAVNVYMCGDWDRAHHPAMVDRGTGRDDGYWVATAITDYKQAAP